MTFLLIGIIIGWFLNQDKVTTTTHSFNRTVQKSLGMRHVGVVKRPTAEDLRERGTPIEAAKQAMAETLEKIL